MLDDSTYAEDIKSFLEEETNLVDISHLLKHSEDLESDVMYFLIEIEKIPDWGENRLLIDLYDLLRVIQQEIIFYTPIFDLYTANLHAIVLFANLLMTSGRSIGKNDARALELLQKVLEIDPEHAYAWASLGGLYLEGGDNVPRNPVKASDNFLEAIRIRPDYPFALAHLGELLRVGDSGIEKNEATAYHYLQRAIHADPENIFALGSLGELLRSGGKGVPIDRKKAQKLLEKAIALAPNYGYALAALGEIYMTRVEDEASNHTKAYACFEKAYELDQNNVFVLTHLADLLRIENKEFPHDHRRACILAERSLEIDPNQPYALWVLGYVYKYTSNDFQDHKKACHLFESALELDPHYYPALIELGFSLSSDDNAVKKDEKRAYELLEKALQIAPDDSCILTKTAELLYNEPKIRNVKLALEYVKKALANSPNSQTHSLFACIVIDEEIKDEYHLIYENLEKAVTLDSNNLLASYYLIQYLLEGIDNIPIDLERASKLLEYALTQIPNNKLFLDLQSKLTEKKHESEILKKNPSKANVFSKKLPSWIKVIFYLKIIQIAGNYFFNISN